MGKNKEYYLNIRGIQDSLEDVQENWELVNSKLLAQRETLTQQIIENLLAGYEYVDSLIKNRIDIFEDIGQILELNHIVLCGVDRTKWISSNIHILETQKQFSQQIPEALDWYNRKKGRKSVYKIAAGIYAMGVSQPQFFIEGNHRTGALIASYLLIKDGRPPFVLTRDNAKAFFDPSTLLKSSHKEKLVDRRYYIKKYRKGLAEFFEEGEKKFRCKNK